jgi:hypothetical protein
MLKVVEKRDEREAGEEVLLLDEIAVNADLILTHLSARSPK